MSTVTFPKFEFSDLRILEGLARYGPRNVTEVARNLDVHPETVRKRLKRLSPHFFLRTYVNIYHTFLGQKKALVFAEATPGYEDLLFNCLKQNDFWISIARCYGSFEGCVGVFTIPIDHCFEFERFIKQVIKLGAARNIQIFWCTCFQAVHSRCTWFDQEAQTWDFKWDEWIDEIPAEATELPFTLVDPDDFPIKGDYVDVFILKELEKNAATSFTTIAEKLGISRQLVGYHYRNHIIERGLIEGFEVSDFRFGVTTANVLFFIFRFDCREKLAKFASSLLDKPFVRVVGKVLGQNALYGYVYLPKAEFRRFIDQLSKLIRTGFLQGYDYVIQDLRKSSHQTISYEYFRRGAWVYDHKKHVEDLRNLMNTWREKEDTPTRTLLSGL